MKEIMSDKKQIRDLQSLQFYMVFILFGSPVLYNINLELKHFHIKIQNYSFQIRIPH